MRTVIGTAIIKDKNVLLVKKNQTWILPGGKPNAEETDEFCLEREVAEELSGARIKNITYYKTCIGKSPHRGDIIQVKVYRADLQNEEEPPKPSAEISEAEWVKEWRFYHLSESTKQALTLLEQDALI